MRSPTSQGQLVHRSTAQSRDGTRVLIYSQWANPEAVQAMLMNPTMGEHHAEITAVATVDVARFAVSSVLPGSTDLPKP